MAEQATQGAKSAIVLALANSWAQRCDWSQTPSGRTSSPTWYG